MAAANACRRNQYTRLLEELEAHLREEIERQMNSGLSTENAFQMAVHQMGKAVMLNNEFKKNGGAAAWLERLMTGVCAVFVAFIVLMGSLAVAVAYSGLVDRVLAATAMLGGVIIACRWKHLVRLLPLIADRRKRWTAGLTCIACGFAIPSFIGDVVLPHRMESPFSPTESWLFLLLTVLICAGLGLLLNERQREALSREIS